MINLIIAEISYLRRFGTSVAKEHSNLNLDSTFLVALKSANVFANKLKELAADILSQNCFDERQRPTHVGCVVSKLKINSRQREKRRISILCAV